MSDRADLSSPLFWAVFIGWILSVVLHEFAHGLTAWWGGDYTIRERGGLSLNPLQYVDPVMSLALPIIFFLIGGLPLPGGATYVRRDLLRNRFWMSAVAAAGPLTNFFLYLLLTLSLNPHLGWVGADQSVVDWSPAQRLVGTLAFLQLISVFLNLIPIPPLDGYLIISPFLSRQIQERLARGPVAVTMIVLLFFVLFEVPMDRTVYPVMDPITSSLGVSFHRIVTATRLSLYGHP